MQGYKQQKIRPFETEKVQLGLIALGYPDGAKDDGYVLLKAKLSAVRDILGEIEAAVLRQRVTGNY